MRSKEVGWHSYHSQLPNSIAKKPQIAILRVDEVLNTLSGGSVFTVFAQVAFTRILSSWLLFVPRGDSMSGGAAQVRGWFVSVMAFVTTSLETI